MSNNGYAELKKTVEARKWLDEAYGTVRSLAIRYIEEGHLRGEGSVSKLLHALNSIASLDDQFLAIDRETKELEARLAKMEEAK